MRVSSRFGLELLPRALRLSWHSFPETRKNIYEALIWQTINIISSTLTWTHNSHREYDITNKMSIYFLFILSIKQKLSSKWGVWKYFPWERWNKKKNPNHIMRETLCVSVWCHVHGWVGGKTWNLCRPMKHTSNTLMQCNKNNWKHKWMWVAAAKSTLTFICMHLADAFIHSDFIISILSVCMRTWDGENHQPTPENTSKTSSKHNLDRDGSSCDI